MDGGWFTSLTVQVRQSGQWVGVSNLAITPPYAGNNGVSYETYTMTFTPIQGDAIRIYGVAGGTPPPSSPWASSRCSWWGPSRRLHGPDTIIARGSDSPWGAAVRTWA